MTIDATKLVKAFDQLLYARVAALNGDKKAMAAMLKKVFSGTEAQKLAGVKKFVAANPDFKVVADSAEFQQAMKTESAVKEECGHNCANCAKRKAGKCDDPNCEK